jgi:zinc D-Ala-D-Ala carboxypeptidase
MTRLSEHFTLDELLRNSGEHAAPDHVVVNARHTAAVLEQVRRQLGDVPVIPSSWYRPPAKNADTLGAARNSAHLSGYGVDFNVPGMTPREVLAALAPHVRGMAVDQLIDERDHVHLSADPRMRRQVLVEIREGEYLPWQGAGTTTGPTIKAAPEAAPALSLPWWAYVLAALALALLNFLTKSSTPAP